MNMKGNNTHRYARFLAGAFMLAAAFVCGTLDIQAQGSYTLTNGRLWWYENPSWQPTLDAGWTEDKVGVSGLGSPNPTPVYQTEVAFDLKNGSAQVHPYDTTTANITHIVDMGDKYLRLDIDGMLDGEGELIAGKTPAVKYVDTSAFDLYCVWERTAKMGNYYQTWGNYRFYLMGEQGRLFITPIKIGEAIEGITQWYDWDYGAAITKVDYVGESRKENYYWIYLDTVGLAAGADGIPAWTMTSSSSYQRPEDVIYEGYTYTTGLSYEEAEAARVKNEFNKTYFYPISETNRKAHGVGALFLPVEVIEHSREAKNLSANQGLMPQGKEDGKTQVVLQKVGGGDSTVKMTSDKADGMIRYGQTARIEAAVAGIGSSVTVQKQYTEYVQEIYRYGVHLRSTSRIRDEFGSAGIPVKRTYYYWDGAKHTTPSSTENVTLRAIDTTYSLVRSSGRLLSLEEHNKVGGGKYATVYCQDQPIEDFKAQVKVTIHYEEDIEQTEIITVWVSSDVPKQNIPIENRDGINAPLVAGYVFGGGRMANVGGNTNVTIHSCDSIVAVYGGNDIAGWVQGSTGSNVQLGTIKTSATEPVHVGYVYGGGCGYYHYAGLFFNISNGEEAAAARASYEATPHSGINEGSYCFNGKVYPWDAYKDEGVWKRKDGSIALPVVDHTFAYLTPGSAGGCTMSDFMTCERGEHGDGTIPYLGSAHITVGVSDATENYLLHNDYILVDSLFGGAENAFIGSAHHSWDESSDCTVEINGGTILAVFGGNNYGGSVAPTSYTMIDVKNTKLTNDPAATVNRPYSGYGRTFGIRHLYGGGNMVTSAHAEVNIHGGMVDSCFMGGNRATVNRPIGNVNCTGEHFIYTNPSVDAIASGALNLQAATISDDDWNKLLEQNPGGYKKNQGLYNVRALFGGNNRAEMNTFSQINLASGGVNTIYGGGNMGDMTNIQPIGDPAFKLYQITKTDFNVEGYEKDAVVSSEVRSALMAHGASENDFTLYRDFEDSIQYALGYKKYDGGGNLVDASAGDEQWHYGDAPGSVGCFVRSYPGSRIMVDNLYGGCRIANVTSATGLWLSGGCFGNVRGGNDISGDVGTTRQEGTWVVLEKNAIVLQNAYGGSDGFYHCIDHVSRRYIATSEAEMNEELMSNDPYDDYIGMLVPTHNKTNMYVKGGTVLYSVYGGGVMTDVGFENGLNYYRHDYQSNTDVSLVNPTGSRNGSIHFQLSGTAEVGSRYYHQNALSSNALDGTLAWRTDNLSIESEMTGHARRAALVTRKKNNSLNEAYDVVANHDGNVYGGGYLASVWGLGYAYVGGSPVVYGSFYAGNDCNGRIESFGTYSMQGVAAKDYTASDNTTHLNIEIVKEDGTGTTLNSAYSSYVLIEGTPQITSVYGSGNGAYNYGAPDRPQYSSVEPVCLDAASSTNRPEQSSTFIDIHTSGGFIDTVFGGGNGIGVTDAVTILLNNQMLHNPDRIAAAVPDRNGNSHNDTLFVGTIFGGNNLEKMTCVPNIRLAKGMVKNVFGGGNAGAMTGITSKKDLCGHMVDSLSTYILVESENVTVADSIFGGCRMADVEYKAFIDVRNTTESGIDYIFGGNDISGTIKQFTRIDVSGGSVNHIFGGSNGRYDYRTYGGMENDGKYNVYEFGTDNLIATGTTGVPNVDSTNVNLYGGTIRSEVFGGGNLGDCRLTRVEVNDMLATTDKTCNLAGKTLDLTLHAAVYGGGKGIDDDLNQRPRRGNVIGNDNGAAATHVELHHANKVHDARAYGGGRGGDVDNTYIRAYDTWSQSFEAIYGGCWGSDVNQVAHVIMEGSVKNETDTTARNVYGGNDFTGNVYRTDIQILSGRYGNIFGGGNGNYDETKYNPTIESSPYYGADKRLFVPNNEYAVINFEDGIVTGNLYGGGRQGTTLRYKTNPDNTHMVDANNRFIPDTARADYATRNTNYTDATDYSYILVNVHGGNFEHNIFAGAMGVNKGSQLMYGLKQLNMDGGMVHESVYGGSENVNDGYPVTLGSAKEDPAVTKEKTKLRPSSILNIAGGYITNNVYGGGYLGDIYGSSFVNIGVNAIENSKVWEWEVNGQESAYIMFKPGYSYNDGGSTTYGYVDELLANELQLYASVYSGANWGNNTGSSDFSKRGFFGGESHIYVDGLGYKTFMTEVGKQQMNIGKSLIGAGTSAEGGDVYSRIDLRNYGAMTDRCIPTRNLAAIQRADGVWLNNTAINYTGSTDAISAYLSNQVTFNRIDTLNCVGYNVIDVNATVTNVGEVNFYKQEAWPYQNFVLTDRLIGTSNAENVCLESADICDKLDVIDRDDVAKAFTALVMNNGINVDFIDETGKYSPVFGFAYVIAQTNTNAVITALAKFDGGSNPIWTTTKHGNTVEYGGFLPSCTDSLQVITGKNGDNKEDLTWCTIDPNAATHCDKDETAQYPYSNYGTDYRVWTIGKGKRRRYAVILAHAEPAKLQPLDPDVPSNKENWKNQFFRANEGSNDYSLALAHSQLILPPTTPGHYYKISTAGVTISDDNNEMDLATGGWNPNSWQSVSNTWATQDADGLLGEWVGNTGEDISGVKAIVQNPGKYFGLMMSSGENFAVDGTGHYIKPQSCGDDWTGSTLLSGNFNVNEINNFTTAEVGVKKNTTPILDLFLTYNPDFSNTLVGAVTFTLVECVYQGPQDQGDGKTYKDVNGQLVSADGYLVNAEGKYIDQNQMELADQSDVSKRVRGNFDKTINADIDIEITISTILESFNNLEYEMLAMFNEGRSNIFARKAILPATLEPREVYIESIEWAPTDISTTTPENISGNGEWLGENDPNNGHFKLTSDSVNTSGNDSTFCLRLHASDAVSSTLTASEGWYTRDIISPANLVTMCGKSGIFKNTGDIDKPYDHTPISLMNPSNENLGKRIGVVDGRGESAIDLELIFDGTQVYPKIENKGYIGKAILHMASYKPKMYDPKDRNEFTITINVKSRDKGDTIYLASANSVSRGVYTLTYGDNNSDNFKNYPGKRPSTYLKSFQEALSNSIYQEGDVLAILDAVTIGADNTAHIRGYEYMPIPIIRYYGHHSDFPGEECIYRNGPMIVVSGANASLRATCIDFQGSAIGKLETKSEAFTSEESMIARQTGEARNKYADTNMSFAPIIQVMNGGVVELENGTIVEENFNAYGTKTGQTDKTFFGAINVATGGTLQLHNNVIVRNNLSSKLGTSEAHHPTNGAIYVDGGEIQLLESSLNSVLSIENNRLFNGGTYWKQVKDGDKLMRYAFDTTQTAVKNAQLANVLLTRTVPTSGDTAMKDGQTDLITFSSDLSSKWRIGVSKWFPGYDPLVRDTIQIAYNATGSFTTSIYEKGIFFSDEDEYIFANTGVDPHRIYLQRCASFKMQEASVPFPEYAAIKGLKPNSVLEYYANPEVSCPTGGDLITYRVQGGFFPYTYEWILKEGDDGEETTVRTRTTTGDNETVLDRVKNGNFNLFNNAVEDVYTTSSVGSTRNANNKVYNYTLIANDITKHCELKKKIQTTITINAGNNNWTAAAPVENWTNVQAPNDPPVVAAGTRNFPGVKIRPIVWSDRSLGTILVHTFEGVEKENTKNDSIYVIDGETREDLDDIYFCQGDRIRLATWPRQKKVSVDPDPEKWEPTSKFIMWDFDPYYSNEIEYTVPATDATVVAYYGPFDYWKDTISTPTLGHVRYDNTDEYEVDGTKQSGDGFVVTHHGDVHIYDKEGLAWFISSVNGLNGTQATPYYFNTVYLHEMKDNDNNVVPYDMKDHKWTAVGLSQHPFRGRFVGVGNAWNATDPSTTTDGKKVVIKNILVDEPNSDYAGFFAHLDKATVENIELNSALIRGSQYVGTLAAESNGSKVDKVVVADASDTLSNGNVEGVTTTTILTTRHTSGGLIGKSKDDNLSNLNISAKYVGNAVYTGGIIGYGTGSTKVENSSVRNTNVMQALYSGGIAGYLDGKAPVSLFHRSKSNSKAAIRNNYIRFEAVETAEHVGGIVGYAKNTIIQNNYVYGQMVGTVNDGAVGGEIDGGTEASYNYYAVRSTLNEVGQQKPGSTISATYSFDGSGNQVLLSEKSFGTNNLTRALNLWVREQGGSYNTWRSDIEGVNNGYPRFGTPDLIPVHETVVINGCDSVEWDGTVYYFDAEAESHVIDSLMMVDSTARLIIKVHYTSREQYSDSMTVGNDYYGYGFTFTAAESELLRATIRQFGKATIVLTDTLQSVTGCDSIICLSLTVGDDGNSNLGTDEPSIVKRPEIKVYPNPTTGRVTVEADDIQRVELYDNEGRRLQDYTTSDRQQVTVDVTGYAAGSYYLRIHTPHDVTIQKLIKK